MFPPKLLSEGMLISHITSWCALKCVCMLNMRTRNKQNSQPVSNEVANIKLLRSSACIDAVKQLPSDAHNLGNWRIACDYCFRILNSISKRALRVQNPLDPCMRCSKYLLEEVSDGKITINTSKCNVLCGIAQEKPIDIKPQINYPSKRCAI